MSEMMESLTAMINQSCSAGLRPTELRMSDRAAHDLAAELTELQCTGVTEGQIYNSMKAGESFFMGIPIVVAGR